MSKKFRVTSLDFGIWLCIVGGTESVRGFPTVHINDVVFSSASNQKQLSEKWQIMLQLQVQVQSSSSSSKLSWSLSYGSWINNYMYLCNQNLSPLTLRVLNPFRRGVHNTTLCDKVCQWLATGWWFSQSTSVSSTNKTDCHDITEILLKVVLNTTNNPTHLEWNHIIYIQHKRITYRFSFSCPWVTIFLHSRESNSKF